MIGVREPQPAASEAFVKFADAHRSIEKFGIRLLKTIKPVGHGSTCVSAREGGGDSVSCRRGPALELEHSGLGVDLWVVCGPCSPTDSQPALGLACLLIWECPWALTF